MGKIASLRHNALRKIGDDFGFINSNSQCYLTLGRSR